MNTTMKASFMMCLFFTYAAAATDNKPFEADATQGSITKVLESINGGGHYYVLGEGGDLSTCHDICFLGIIVYCCDSYSLPRKIANYA
ncbi:hypothetical protein PIB30_069426 [Stylosanthes scabra]|uniref:Uncharacterized protein n=1 Tax=Stylosanthes scabra TaxID=79078 RepID=A0ABU6TPR4_9FABA|nr:hypothetical protein [Stylosanthes scabra]